MKLSPTTGALMPTKGFSKLGTSHAGSVYQSSDGVRVISSLDVMFLPGTGDTETGPTWLISVSKNGVRCSDADLHRVSEAFEMPAFDEDNHYPGISRALFCPVDERYRSACECKVNETVVVEPDGYTWTTDPAKGCRGCDLEEFGRRIGRRMPCPIHAQADEVLVR